MEPFAWPICVCAVSLILGLFFLLRHREDISHLLSRTKHIGKSGLTTSDTSALATQTEAKDVTKPSAAEELLRGFDNQLLVEQEGLITDFLNEKQITDPKERDRVLTRYLASSYIVNRFEALNTNIFGSQLQALQMLNQKVGTAVPTVELEGWYQVGVATAPQMYGPNGENYTFGQWLGFMYRFALIAIEGADAHITVAGQEFLKYMVQSSYSSDKIG
jgi:hypothetical protein